MATPTIPGYETGRSRTIQNAASTISLSASAVIGTANGDGWITDASRLEIYYAYPNASLLVEPYFRVVGGNAWQYGFRVGKRTGGAGSETWTNHVMATITRAVALSSLVTVWEQVAGHPTGSYDEVYDDYINKAYWESISWTVSGSLLSSWLMQELYLPSTVLDEWKEWTDGVISSALTLNSGTISTSEYAKDVRSYALDFALSTTSTLDCPYGPTYPSGSVWYQRPYYQWRMGTLPSFATGASATCNLNFGTTPGAGTPASVAYSGTGFTASWGSLSSVAGSWSGAAIAIPNVSTLPTTVPTSPTTGVVNRSARWRYQTPHYYDISPVNVDIASGASVAGDWAIDWGHDFAGVGSQNAPSARHALVSGTSPGATSTGYEGAYALHSDGAIVLSGNYFINTGGVVTPDPNLVWNTDAPYVRLATESAASLAAGSVGPLCKARIYAPWNALSLTHASSLDMEGGSAGWVVGGAGNWAATGSASASVVSGALRLSGAGGAARTFSAAFSGAGPFPWEWHPAAAAKHEECRRIGYRYLKVRFKTSVAGAVVSLLLRGMHVQPGKVVAERRFDLTGGAAGVYVERVIDLLQRPPGPYNLSGSASAPFAGVLDTLPDWPYVREIAFDGVGAGATLDVEWIRGIRQDAAALATTLSDASVNLFVGRDFALSGWSDGWHSLEARWKRAGASPSEYRLPHSGSLAQLAAEINNAGWSASSLLWYDAAEGNTLASAPYADPWSGWGASLLVSRRGTKAAEAASGALPLADAFDMDASVKTLGGDGLIASGGTPGLTLDRAASASALTLKAQRSAWKFKTYPGAGDVGLTGTAAGGYAARTPVGVWAVVGGQAIGTVLAENQSESSDSLAVAEAREDVGAGIVPLGSPVAKGNLAPVGGYSWHRGDTSLRGSPANSSAIPPAYRMLVNDIASAPGDNAISPTRASLAPLHRARPYVRLWLYPALAGLSLIHTASGQLCLASQGTGASVGKIRFRRAEYPIPTGWTLDVWATTGTGDSQPCLYRLPAGRLGLLFTRDGSGVYETASDDDGETWSDPTMAFANASSPAAEIDRATGKLIRLAIVVDGSGYVLKATEQAPGDASPSAAWTLQRLSGGSLVDLRVERKGAAIRSAPHGSGALVLSCILEGDTATTEMVSHDDARTWS